MSRVFFHSPSGDAELAGFERGWLAHLGTQTGMSLLPQETFWPEDLRVWAELTGRPAPDRRTAQEFLDWLRRRLGSPIADERLLSWHGRPVRVMSLISNTALILGSDPVRLGVRIHSQCELHGYVEGPNRAWLAGIIDAGRAAGVYRANAGWEQVAALLRARADEPVVMSFSGGSGFPDWYGIGWAPDGVDADEDPEAVEEAWDALPTLKQWEAAMTWLRGSRMGLEIKPDDWQRFRFTHRLSMLDLTADDWRDRLDRAFGLAGEAR